MEDALRCGCMAGVHNLAVPDAVSGVKTWDETLQEVRAGRPKNALTIPMDGFRYDAPSEHWRR